MSSCIKMFFAVGVVVVSILDLTLSCSCYRNHPQMQFCRGDLAYRFKVIAADHVRGSRYDEVVLSRGGFSYDWPLDVTRRYTIKDFHLYQGNTELTTNTSIQYIYTESNPGWTCGASLTTGSTYAVIGGSYRDGRLSIFQCDNIYDLSTLTSRERIFLLINWIYRFPGACQHCEVVECLEDNDRCEGEQGPGECHYHGEFQAQPVSRAVCLRRKSHCVWMNGFQVISSRPSPSF